MQLFWGKLGDFCEPRSWRERVRFATGSSTHAEGIIDQLVESGVISPVLVEASRNQSGQRIMKKDQTLARRERDPGTS